MNSEMNESLDNWLKGLYSEIEFWNLFIGEKGWIYSSKWERIIDSSRSFSLESAIPQEMYGKEYSFVDVGSGPFSRCGFVTDKVELKHCAVDPLAEVYKFLKNRDGVENGIHLVTGFVELLDKIFDSNSFDMVHMSNSLDHSFNALIGIYQLINICKVGGKVILRHKQNEAVTEKYEGLHQWNLWVDIEKNKFVIWRENEQYNVNEIFADYVDIKCSIDSAEDIFYRVEMIKKKEIQIPKNDIYDNMLIKIYSYMLSVITNDVLKNINSPKSVYIEKVIDYLDKNVEGAKSALALKGLKRVAIYGLGKIGCKLVDCLEKQGVLISGIIDQRDVEYNGHVTVRIEDNLWKEAEVVLVTTYSGYGQIKNELLETGYCGKVFHIDEALGLSSFL